MITLYYIRIMLMECAMLHVILNHYRSTALANGAISECGWSVIRSAVYSAVLPYSGIFEYAV